MTHTPARTDDARGRYREKRIAKIMETCIHFTGVQHQQCKAGVVYDSFREPSGRLPLPCIPDVPQPTSCDKCHLPTRAQAERELVEEDAAFTKVALAHRAAHDDAKAKKFGKGKGGADSVECPVCKTGRIYYRVASYNGHMHAKCETEGCVSWME